MKRTVVRAIMIVIVGFLFRTIQSCCDCTDNYSTFSYVGVDLVNIDNSGRWSRITSDNTMRKNAVAFEVIVFGESDESLVSKIYSPSGFSQAKALGCNCDDKYKSNQTITGLSIVSIYNINSEYDCGSDVTSLFVANNCFDCDDISYFYCSIDDLLQRVNSKYFYNDYLNRFIVYLTTAVEDTIAQFEFSVALSNGQVLSGLTNEISIK
jgi:hypothetical protein